MGIALRRVKQVSLGVLVATVVTLKVSYDVLRISGGWVQPGGPIIREQGGRLDFEVSDPAVTERVRSDRGAGSALCHVICAGGCWQTPCPTPY